MTKTRHGLYSSRTAVALLGLALGLLAAGTAAFADEVPVIQGDEIKPRAEGRQTICPPPDGFTEITAESSTPAAVQVDQPNNAFGGWGVNYTVKQGGSLAIVTVTQKNPKTGEIRKCAFFVNTSAVRFAAASSTTAVVGQPVPLPAGTPAGGITDFNPVYGGTSGAGGFTKNGTTTVFTPEKPGIWGVEVKRSDGLTEMVFVYVAPKPAAPAPAAPKTPTQPSTPKPDKEGGGD